MDRGLSLCSETQPRAPAAASERERERILQRRDCAWETGMLLLGNSEGASIFSSLFQIEQKHKVTEGFPLKREENGGFSMERYRIREAERDPRWDYASEAYGCTLTSRLGLCVLWICRCVFQIKRSCLSTSDRWTPSHHQPPPVPYTDRQRVRLVLSLLIWTNGLNGEKSRGLKAGDVTQESTPEQRKHLLWVFH